jgi:hypothetical protein
MIVFWYINGIAKRRVLFALPEGAGALRRIFLRKTPLFWRAFPYVCPEPVLVKRWIFGIKWLQKASVAPCVTGTVAVDLECHRLNICREILLVHSERHQPFRSEVGRFELSVDFGLELLPHASAAPGQALPLVLGLVALALLGSGPLQENASLFV